MHSTSTSYMMKCTYNGNDDTFTQETFSCPKVYCIAPNLTDICNYLDTISN